MIGAISAALAVGKAHSKPPSDSAQLQRVVVSCEINESNVANDM